MWWFKRKKTISVSSLHITRDIHTHLLPGVDDGKFVFDTAADTLALMYRRGVRQIWMTPHVMAGLYDNTKARLTDVYNNVKISLANRDQIPEIALGAEYMVDDALLTSLREGSADMLAVLNNHVLIEMSYYSMSPQIYEVVQELTRAGYKPILAHPERYPYMSNGAFDRLYEMGCVFQLNLYSATGIYGDTSVRIMKDLFERSYYKYLGTDVHSPNQLDSMYGSSIDEKIAFAGENASLWRITYP